MPRSSIQTADKRERLASEECKSTLISRNVTVSGRRTSVRLEPEMWGALKEIAKREKCSIHDICTLISMRKNEHTSLTAAIRVFLMLYFRASSTEEGHDRAGHGSFEYMKLRARIPLKSKAGHTGHNDETPAIHLETVLGQSQLGKQVFSMNY